MAFSTGRCMCHPHLQFPFDEEDVVAMVRRVFAGRVVFHDGDDEIAPGLTLHHIGGHSMGLQMLRVKTRRGWVVLAADAAHLYAHIEGGRVFPLVYNVHEVVEGYRTLRKLATSPRHVVPGHDPLVLARYPAAKWDSKAGWHGSMPIRRIRVLSDCIEPASSLPGAEATKQSRFGAPHPGLLRVACNDGSI